MDVTTIIVAILGSGIINTLISCLVTLKEKKSEVAKSLRLLMKDRLRYLCAHYIQQGWIYEDELEDIIIMHECYHTDLKGNGYLDEMMRRVKELEVRGMGV